ncbi:Helix-turn-helix domain-containing protein [Cnuella takakiae]|uniref:Helix-turn-helix domain-containing protein n=1 Tax=Cnuella takakiae TaxID=1302690 RepID=A0A1M4ZIA5_9BACT|nr:helix-turn-helix domain-containing protein [Cnuella takakiae]OLY94212.1 hypothetical protein BUE76_21735 [Cnuella takakiae]SHF17306.1 Helix-turn-helix domain-containing protein [Cnuella takakiae]
MERGQAPILFPYEPERFWEQIRAIIKEELATKEAVTTPERTSEEFLPRMEVARMLRVSLVTLNSWVKMGLPSHKQRGKVYFLQSEVLKYIKDKAYK